MGLPEYDIMKGALHRHWKGGLYRPLLIAYDASNLDELIVYSSEEDGKIWVRPLSEWHDYIEEAGCERFVQVRR